MSGPDSISGQKRMPPADELVHQHSMQDIFVLGTCHGTNSPKRQRCVSPCREGEYSNNGQVNGDYESDYDLGGAEDRVSFLDCVNYDDDDANQMEEDEINDVLAILEDVEMQSLSKQSIFRVLKQTKQRQEEKVKFAICKTLGILIQSRICGQTHGDRLDLILAVRQLLLEMTMKQQKRTNLDLNLDYLLQRLGELILSRSSYFPPRFVNVSISINGSGNVSISDSVPPLIPSIVDSERLALTDLSHYPSTTSTDSCLDCLRDSDMSSDLSSDTNRDRAMAISKGRRLLERLASKSQALMTERTIVLMADHASIAESALESRIQGMEGMQEIVAVWVHSLKSNCYKSTQWYRDQLDITIDCFESADEDLKGMMFNFAYYVSLQRIG